MNVLTKDTSDSAYECPVLPIAWVYAVIVLSVRMGEATLLRCYAASLTDHSL